MLVRTFMVAAAAAAASRAVPSSPTEDDLQLLALAPGGLSNEDSALAPELPGMALAQLDVAESLLSLFSSSDAAEPAQLVSVKGSSSGTVVSVPLSSELQTAPASPEPAAAAEPSDTAMVQQHSAESAAQPIAATELAAVAGSSGGTVVSVRLSSELQTAPTAPEPAAKGKRPADLAMMQLRSAESAAQPIAATELAAATGSSSGGTVVSVRLSSELQKSAATEASANGTKTAPHSVLFQEESGLATMTDRLVKQFQNELELPDSSPANLKDKRTLAVLTTLVLPAFFGVDRCYLGQYILGTLKGLTFGGCAIWALLDWCYVMYSCLRDESTMNMFMFRANFEPSSLHGAFYIALFGALISCAVCVRTPDHQHHHRFTQKI